MNDHCMDMANTIIEQNEMEPDKENKSTSSDGKTIELHAQKKHEVDTLYSPPKKKLKQDNIKFNKVLPEDITDIEPSKDVLNQQRENLSEEIVEVHVNPLQDISKTPLSSKEDMSKTPLSCNKDMSKTPLSSKEDMSKTPLSSNKDMLKTPVSSNEDMTKTPVSSEKIKKGSPPMTKAERLKLKELKEQQKLLKQQELEEKRKKREEEKLIRQAEKEKREQERLEKLKLKEEEKKRKDEEKRMKDEQKEIERRKKEELKEIEQKKRDAEREKKEAERKQKEEQKRMEEEKKKMEEEAARRKKEKAANQFKSFFKKTSVILKKEEPTDCQRFKPFQVKPNMSLAPTCRAYLKNKAPLDKCFNNDADQSDCITYLRELSFKEIKPLVTRRQFRREHEKQRKSELQEKKVIEKNSVDDIIVIDDDNVPTDADDEEEDDDTDISFNEQILMKTKFLQFSENTRPAYYGTWRKSTKNISGRKPFALDHEIFNYDIDSDEEWIDEPGEDCSDNDDDDDEEEKETEDDQDGFFVPHGYLSDDEGVKDSDEDDVDSGENSDKVITNPNSREDEKLKSKVCSFEVKFDKKIKLKKPVCFGINYDAESVPKYLQDYFTVELFEAVLDDKEETGVGCSPATEQNSEVNSPFPGQPPNGCNIPQTVPDEAMEFLIRLVHGNTGGLKEMVKCFREFWCCYVKQNDFPFRSFISKRQLERKIQCIATRGHNSEISKVCYTVHSETLHKHNLQELKLGTGLPLLKTFDQCDVSMETESSDICNNNAKNSELNNTANPT